MKFWQNNWEKNIGNKLLQGETQPESHIWQLIENELNEKEAAVKRKTYKSIAAIAILLLITSISIFLPITPNAELANFYTNIYLSELKIAPLKSNYVQLADKNSNGIKNAPYNEKIENQKEAQIVKIAPIESLDFSKKIITTFNRANLSNKTEIDSKLEANLNSEFEMAILSENYSEKEDNQFSYRKSFNKSFTDRTYIKPLIIKNSLLMSAHSSELLVSQQIGILTAESKLLRLNSIDNKDDLFKYDASIVELKSLKSEVAEFEENEVIVSNLNEVEQNWLENTMQELNEWKTVVEQEQQTEIIPVDIDKEFIELLIEEAELDKEDPMTIIQQVENDLNTAKNINKGFHIGLITGYQNTWVAKASRNPEISRQYVKNLANPGYQVGLNMGYDFTKHFGIMTELKYSDEGMHYFNTLTAKREHLDLKYLEVPFYLKVKHSKPSANMKPMVFNYLLGVNFSDLRKVKSFVNGEEKRFAQDYNTSEWGLTAGFDFDFYFNKNFFVTVGTRGSMNGLSKSFPKFKGEEGNGTLNYSIGLFTRINFRLPGK